MWQDDYFTFLRRNIRSKSLTALSAVPALSDTSLGVLVLGVLVVRVLVVGVLVLGVLVVGVLVLVVLVLGYWC